LKRMWIALSVRGLGVGRRMLNELERLASKRGIRLVRLETNRTLKEAIALYRGFGYVEVRAFNTEPYAHHWFEKRFKQSPGAGKGKEHRGESRASMGRKRRTPVLKSNANESRTVVPGRISSLRAKQVLQINGSPFTLSSD